MDKNLEKKIVAVEFYREAGLHPSSLQVEQLKVEVTWEGGGTNVLFYYFPSTMAFTSGELVGLTGRQALELYRAKGRTAPPP